MFIQKFKKPKFSIKQQRSGSKKEGKYLVTVSIITPHHSPYIYKEVGYDIGQIMENMSQKLLRNLSKRAKHRNKTSIRKINLPVIR